MLDLTEQITREYEHEQRSNRKAVSPDDIPVSYEAITPEWLTHILCKGHPDAKVINYRLDLPNDGQTNRRRIFVDYNMQGKAAGLPPSVFCKAAHQLSTRLQNARGGLIQNEVMFYNEIRPLLDIETPPCLFAAYSTRSYNYIAVFDDLLRHGAVFCDQDTDFTLQRAESQMIFLANLHGRFYGSAELDAYGLVTFETMFDNIDAWLGWEKYCSNGFLAAEAVIPGRLFRRHAEIWPATMKSIPMPASFFRTLTHNDNHPGNWYIAGDGGMVLCDWQCFGKGFWARDLAYAMSGSLTVENRRAWEKELLRTYLETLRAAGGPEIAFADAWKHYRQQIASALSFWTATLAMATIHPTAESLEYIRRMTTAIDDLDALDSFD